MECGTGTPDRFVAFNDDILAETMPPMTRIHATLSRRQILTGAGAFAAAALAGCSSTRKSARAVEPVAPPPSGPVLGLADPALMYAPVVDNGFKVPGVPWQKVPRKYHRQLVPNITGEPAGTLVVDTNNHFVYFTQYDGQAMRYGVGLGREGFEWTGRGYIERKAVWPKWHPPEEMIDREPELEKYRTTYDKENDLWLGGMDGGPMNPLGARALYIYEDGKDTLYRLHGSPEWWSIGKNVSSGCVRLMNQDIIDLYNRVPEQTPVVVTGNIFGPVA